MDELKMTYKYNPKRDEYWFKIDGFTVKVCKSLSEVMKAMTNTHKRQLEKACK